MSGVSAIKITFPYFEGGVDFSIVGIGQCGKKAVDKYLSNFDFKAFREDTGIIHSVTFCDDDVFRSDNEEYNGYVYTKCREKIIDEFSKTEFVISLLNVNNLLDFRNACHLAETWRTNNSDIYSVCIYCGDCNQSDLNVLRQVYDQLVLVSTCEELLEPWLLLFKITQSGWIGLDFVDFIYVLNNISHGYYYNDSLNSLDNLSEHLSNLKGQLIDKKCTKFDKNKALVCFEVSPTIDLEIIDKIVPSIYEYIQDSFIWNMRFDESLVGENMRILFLFGESKNNDNC